MDDAKLSTAPEGLKGNFLNVRRVFKNVKVQQYEPGKEVAPGIASIAAYGHTPGHTVFAVASSSQSMLVLSDTTNHPWLFLRNPEWQASFDMDGAMAVAARRRLLDRAAADKMLVQGYHFPFPAAGHVTKSGANYDFVPVMWQPAI
jgi:glyoxylase-like metal-dependent hydrolase (beta-lactamase superfamily II)